MDIMEVCCYRESCLESPFGEMHCGNCLETKVGCILLIVTVMQQWPRSEKVNQVELILG